MHYEYSTPVVVNNNIYFVSKQYGILLQYSCSNKNVNAYAITGAINSPCTYETIVTEGQEIYLAPRYANHWLKLVHEKNALINVPMEGAGNRFFEVVSLKDRKIMFCENILDIFDIELNDIQGKQNVFANAKCGPLEDSLDVHFSCGVAQFDQIVYKSFYEKDILCRIDLTQNKVENMELRIEHEKGGFNKIADDGNAIWLLDRDGQLFRYEKGSVNNVSKNKQETIMDFVVLDAQTILYWCPQEGFAKIDYTGKVIEDRMTYELSRLPYQAEFVFFFAIEGKEAVRITTKDGFYFAKIEDVQNGWFISRELLSELICDTVQQECGMLYECKATKLIDFIK